VAGAAARELVLHLVDESLQRPISPDDNAPIKLIKAWKPCRRRRYASEATQINATRSQIQRRCGNRV